jgi:hypothetical protein
MNAEFTDELVHVLHRAPILRQLDGLSLAMGCMSNHSVSRLTYHADAYTHLRELDLSKQLLDEPSRAAILAVLPQARLDAQRGSRHHRYAMIGE